MNKLVILLVYLLMMSCSSKYHDQEKLISNYVQTIGDTKTDMEFKLLEISEIVSITNRDSLAIIISNMHWNEEKISSEKISKNFVDSIIYKLNQRVEAGDAQIEKFKMNVDSLDKILLSEKKVPNLDLVSKRRAFYLDRINEFTNSAAKVRLLNKIETFIRLNTDEIIVLARKFRVKYSIKNPLLNGVKQETTKTFVFNNDITNILGTE